ncbi:SDR family NAD(P)-dependent oxidoreductase [Sporichthya brevicatena]|uniref:SDR family NAD(P)-dependent oxidoreductase n=1 Tax=Sporichthya brevicatena TaxID=171442 RepID=A0ABP3RY55_9ACTN
MDVTGRTAVVTGGASGIGRATAESLAGAGMTVVLADVDGEAAQKAAAALPGQGHQAVEIDVSDPGSLETLFGMLASAERDLAAVVNAAGIMTGGDTWPGSDLTRMHRVLAVNGGGALVSTTLAARYPLPGDRVVVNVGSAAGVRLLPPDPTYAFTKAGLLHFTRSVAAGASGLRVNIVVPGMVRTPLLETSGRDGVADWLAKRVAGPLLTPEQVAAPIHDLVVGNAHGVALSIELDPEDSSRVVVTELPA